MAIRRSTEVPALRVGQWLSAWDTYRFDRNEHQSKPETGFYLFSLRASYLKALTGVYRRSAKGGAPRALDQNIQRGHEEERSERIRSFVENGFPWCDLGDRSRSHADERELKKPGWLPTAIIVNVLKPGDVRNGKTIATSDTASLDSSGEIHRLLLPKGFSDDWKPQTIFPFEVIDGQHRLWAFEAPGIPSTFELPVVAYHGLDRGWQAYLFWSINITPKRINRSLAFDLYPLLRQQSWLDRVEGISIYRETRCQELVEALWAHPESPWHRRINMLGESKDRREYSGPSATQAAWIRSLMATLVKQWSGTGTSIGGLFGGSQGADETFLRWTRPMQAAFLIKAGSSIRDGVAASRAPWAENLRQQKRQDLFEDDDPAFYGEYSLLSTDQGVRGLLHIVNDLCFVAREELDLADWQWMPNGDARSREGATDQEAVTAALLSLRKSKIEAFFKEMGRELSKFDWRTSSTPDLNQSQRIKQSAYRGSSGYRELRAQITEHLAGTTGKVGRAAESVLAIIAK